MHKATLATLTNPHTQLISIEGSTPRGCQSMQRVLQWPSPAQLKAKAFGFDSLNKNAGKHQSCLRNGAETVDGWSLDLLLYLLCLLCLLITSNYPSGKLLRHALDSRILRVKSKLHARSRYLAQRDLSEWCVPMLRDAPRCTEMHRLLAACFRCPSCPSCPSCPWLTRENLAQAPRHPPRGGSSTSVPRNDSELVLWQCSETSRNALKP